MELMMNIQIDSLCHVWYIWMEPKKQYVSFCYGRAKKDFNWKGEAAFTIQCVNLFACLPGRRRYCDMEWENCREKEKQREKSCIWLPSAGGRNWPKHSTYNSIWNSFSIFEAFALKYAILWANFYRIVNESIWKCIGKCSLQRPFQAFYMQLSGF